MTRRALSVLALIASLACPALASDPLELALDPAALREVLAGQGGELLGHTWLTEHHGLRLKANGLLHAGGVLRIEVRFGGGGVAETAREPSRPRVPLTLGDEAPIQLRQAPSYANARARNVRHVEGDPSAVEVVWDIYMAAEVDGARWDAQGRPRLRLELPVAGSALAEEIVFACESFRGELERVKQRVERAGSAEPAGGMTAAVQLPPPPPPSDPFGVVEAVETIAGSDDAGREALALGDLDLAGALLDREGDGPRARSMRSVLLLKRSILAAALRRMRQLEEAGYPERAYRSSLAYDEGWSRCAPLRIERGRLIHPVEDRSPQRPATR